MNFRIKEKISNLVITAAFSTVIFTPGYAKTEIKTDSNGFKYESVKNNEDLGRIYTLSNGMKIYLVSNKLKPEIETRIVINAGSKNDPDDSTGLAHYLEHMMFKGNDKIGTINWSAEKPYIDKISDLYENHKNVKIQKEKTKIYNEIDKLSSEAAKYAVPNELDIIVQSMGGENFNAYTSDDNTVYMLTIPSNEKEKWIKLERARFENLVLRLFHTELESVYEEFNGSQDDDTFWVMTDIDKKLYNGHPYGEKTTIGTPEDLKNPSMKSIMKFYQTYYTADNMAIIMAGDFDYDSTIKTVSDYWSDFRQNKNSVKEEFTAKDLNQPVIDTLYGKQTESVAIAYRFFGDKDLTESIKLDLLAEILSNQKAGLFDLNIMLKQKLLDATVDIVSRKDYTILLLSGIPKEGQTLEEVKEILLKEVDNLKNGDFSDELVESVKNNIKLDKEVDKENNAYLAERFINLFTNDGNLDDIVKTETEFKKLTKDDIVSFANERLQNNYVAIFKKNGENKLKSSVTKPKITPLSINSENRSKFAEDIMNEKVPVISPKFLDYKKDMKDFKLNNNNNVYYIKNDKTNFFKLMYVINKGSDDDKKLNIASEYLKYLGTDKYTPEEFGENLYKYAVNIDVNVMENETVVTLSGLGDTYDQGLEMLQNLISESKPDKEIYDSFIEDLIKEREDLKSDKKARLDGLESYVVFGRKNPFNDIVSIEDLKKTKPEELTEKISELFDYKHEIFYYGPKSEKDLKKSLENKLESGENKISEKVEKYEEKEMENKIFYTNYDAVQNDILIFAKNKKFTLEDLPYSVLFNTLYSGGASLSYKKLREEKGLVYSVESYIQVPDEKNRSYYLVGYIGTQADKTKEAVETFMDLLNNFVVTEDQFNKAKDQTLKNIENERIIEDDIFQSFLVNRKLGLDGDPRKYIYEKVKSITYKDFQNYFENNVANQKYDIIIVGKKGNIQKTDLKKYGDLKEVKLEEIFGN